MFVHVLALINAVKKKQIKVLGKKVVVEHRGSDCKNIGIDLLSLIPHINHIKDSSNLEMDTIFETLFPRFLIQHLASALCCGCFLLKYTEMNTEVII